MPCHTAKQHIILSLYHGSKCACIGTYGFNHCDEITKHRSVQLASCEIMWSTVPNDNGLCCSSEQACVCQLQVMPCRSEPVLIVIIICTWTINNWIQPTLCALLCGSFAYLIACLLPHHYYWLWMCLWWQKPNAAIRKIFQKVANSTESSWIDHIKDKLVAIAC